MTVNNDLGHTVISDPLRNFKFLVTLTPADAAADVRSGQNASIGFVAVSGLTVTTQSIAYREGGYNTVLRQIPGMTEFSPITFTRGVVLGTDRHHQWARRIFALTAGRGNAGIGDDFRMTVEVDVLGHPNAKNNSTKGGASSAAPFKGMKFKIYNAWLSNLSYSDLSAADNSLLVETMTIVHEGFDIAWANDFSTTPDSLGRILP